MNILTIDFDILFWKTIDVYNDLINPTNTTISSFLAKYPDLDYVIRPDFNLYDYLTQILLSQLGHLQQEDFYFVEEHDGIVPIVEKLGQFDTLMNIDHHHDLGYGLRGSTHYDEGNWVKWLKDKKYFNKYIWVRDDNSDAPTKNSADIEINIEETTIADFKNFDKVVICRSAAWIPVQYWPLYQIWMNIVEEWYYDKKEATEEAKQSSPQDE